MHQLISSSSKQETSYEELKSKFSEIEMKQRIEHKAEMMKLEKHLYEERMKIEKEKHREAKARADMAEVELENLRLKYNIFI